MKKFYGKEKIIKMVICEAKTREDISNCSHSLSVFGDICAFESQGIEEGELFCKAKTKKIQEEVFNVKRLT